MLAKKLDDCTKDELIREIWDLREKLAVMTTDVGYARDASNQWFAEVLALRSSLADTRKQRDDLAHEKYGFGQKESS